MYKVYISGFSKPYCLTGKYYGEDDSYLYLIEGNLKRHIPHNKIVHIESLETEDSGFPTPPAPLPVAEKYQQDRLTPEKLNRTIKQQLGLQNAETSSGEIYDDKKLSVVVSGATNRSFDLDVPSQLFVPAVYTPALSQRISTHPIVKSIMNEGIIFDGVPAVMGDTIHIKTIRLADRVKTVSEGLGVISSISNTVAKFKKPDKQYQESFIPGGKDNGLFSFTSSPFDAPVSLSDEEDEQENIEQETPDEPNESAREEDQADQGPDQAGV